MFNINGEIWKIEICNPNSDVFVRSDGSRTIGVTDDSIKKIFVADGLDDELLKKVIIHEVCHAVIFSTNIYMDIWQEEQLCDFVATYGESILHISYNELYQ